MCRFFPYRLQLVASGFKELLSLYLAMKIKKQR